jgi:glutaminyl-peptide cyclotransferase
VKTGAKLMIGSKTLLFIFLTICVLIGSSCEHSIEAPKEKSQSTTEGSAIDTLSTLTLPRDSGPAPGFDADRAMQYVKEIVAFGPRPIGSANHKKVEDYIVAHLRGDVVEEDTFVADTAEGKFRVRNLIAKYSGTKPGVIVIASHYDTNYPLRNTSFIGANDGASTSAILLEFANQLRNRQGAGSSVWLLWTDAEEATKSWSDADSLYGTRHLAARWRQNGTATEIKAFLLADMLGDADLDVAREMNSTPWLRTVIYEAATRLGYQSHFFAYSANVSDDHLPFLQIGIPSADIIDINYGYHNVFHHTTQDTIDKLSVNSLKISGTVILETLRILDEMSFPLSN